MAQLQLICESCLVTRTVDQPEVDELAVAFQRGEWDRMRCAACGANLAGPLQQALGLDLPRLPLPPGSRTRRHAHLPVALPATYTLREGGPELAGERQGQVKDLSDGGLLLLAPEALPPATRLALRLVTRRGPLLVEGRVIWNDAGAGPPPHQIRHGVEFVAPLAPGSAIDLFLRQVLP